MLCLSFPLLEGDVPGRAGVLTSRKSLSVLTFPSDCQLTPMFSSLEGSFLSVSLPSVGCGSQAGDGEWGKQKPWSVLASCPGLSYLGPLASWEQGSEPGGVLPHPCCPALALTWVETQSSSWQQSVLGQEGSAKLVSFDCWVN